MEIHNVYCAPVDGIEYPGLVEAIVDCVSLQVPLQAVSWLYVSICWTLEGLVG